VAVQRVTSGVQDRAHSEADEKPASARTSGDDTGERSILSDSMVGLFDRLRAAAETHDGE
jgi:hypothetical protein